MIQALYYFGQNYFDKSAGDTTSNYDILRKIKTQLSAIDTRDLQTLMPMTPTWIQKVIKSLII